MTDMVFIREYHGVRIYTGDVIKTNKKVKGNNTFYIDENSVQIYSTGKEDHMAPLDMTLNQLMKKVTKVEIIGNIK